jgi:hypothetical protein
MNNLGYDLTINEMYIRNPMRYARIIPCIIEYKPSYYRLQHLIYKVKRRISIINTIILVILKVITSSIILLGGLYLTYIICLHISPEIIVFQQLASGYCLAMLLYLNILIPYGIETDTYFIGFTHKGKYYGKGI